MPGCMQGSTCIHACTRGMQTCPEAPLPPLLRLKDPAISASAAMRRLATTAASSRELRCCSARASSSAAASLAVSSCSSPSLARSFSFLRARNARCAALQRGVPNPGHAARTAGAKLHDGMHASWPRTTNRGEEC